ncbi:Efg1p NDAI_0B00760 [Naumovozyma dairenensis CBS 421]|uniref:rRNA-processing protein EFG1 n=1 Tax=Naumovozyma dairenensis (strain ATCC 10597 / BCRC 20456 / CBS 421 / NBRC 0211 / NRRL Y-12639) TaxID=1071378 RepID=G0W5P9_NAUDC|nr:hypothetical protein NDAI_0B00760 [Naumovozyma dairenensis CBS 421]CCD23110.1 hypothetical protein NDAI_0B00760 [Naumovozyma dairenensis CBS 421]
MANPKSHRKNNALGASLEMTQFVDAGANKIKKRIRDLERLLKKKKDILPDTVIIEKERTLEALKLELENATLRQKIKHNAKKYHMVRFFERKKALRRYKKALNELTSAKDKDEKKIKATELQERKIDLCYVVNFPKTEKYIALYPNTKNEDDSESDSDNKKENDEKDQTSRRRKAFRSVVIKQMEEGTLPVPFDDILEGKKLNKEGTGILLEDESNTKSGRKDERKAGENKKELNEEEEEEEDDFFE